MTIQGFSGLAVVAVAATAIGVLFFQMEAYRSVGSELEKNLAEIQSLAEKNRNQLVSVSKILKEFESTRTTGISKNSSATEVLSSSEKLILQKISEIEDQLALLRSRNAPVLVDSERAAKMKEEMSKMVPVKSFSRHGPDAIGEEIFQSDYGASLGDQEDILETAFHNANFDSDLTEVRCKSTICKVTYRTNGTNRSSMLGVNSGNNTLAQEISAGYGGADLNIRHGTDESGNNVMYIQESR